MLVNKRENIMREVIKSLRADLKSTGKISRKNSKMLLGLSSETLVEVIQGFGHGFIFEEYECQSNNDIVNNLLSGVGLVDISYVSFKDEGSIVFKTGHILKRQDNKLKLVDHCEQRIIYSELTGYYDMDMSLLNAMLNIVNSYREFVDMEYVNTLTKPLLLRLNDCITQV